MRRMDFLTPLSRERLCCVCAARRRCRRLSAGDQATEPRRSRSSHPGAVCLSNAFWSARNHFFTVFHFLFQLCSAYAQTKHVFLRFINIYIYIFGYIYIRKSCFKWFQYYMTAQRSLAASTVLRLCRRVPRRRRRRRATQPKSHRRRRDDSGGSVNNSAAAQAVPDRLCGFLLCSLPAPSRE